MELEVGRGEAAQDGLVISVDSEPPSLDLANEMPDGQLDGQELTPVSGAEALFRAERLAPESQWDPRSVDPLVQAGSQAVLGRVRREG